MKKGLIMEGGAMRGMFTAGVIDVMMEHGIEFDGAIGVSAGAAFGVNYKSRQIGRAIRYNERFCNDKRYCSLWNLIRDGNLYSKDFCYGEVPLVHDPFDFETYEANPMEFHLVCTDIATGKPHYHEFKGREDHEFDWIRASASMPLVSEIVEINGLKLLDGGIADAIPLQYFESIGYTRNVVILTQHAEYDKKESVAMPFIRFLYRKYPALVQAMEVRHLMYNAQRDYVNRQEAAGKALVIRPAAPLPVKRLTKDPAVLRATYNIGRATAEKRLADIRNYLA
ncbi:MAG: patatin family protein [Akkermansia sp.]|nr:patatin family protein [Akkermansia sp.]